MMTTPFLGMLTVQVALWNPHVVGFAALKNPTVTLVGGPGAIIGVRLALPVKPFRLVSVVATLNDCRGAISMMEGLIVALTSCTRTPSVMVMTRVVVLPFAAAVTPL
jgi:hypothetical protein